jgi:hypothetical protein
MCAMPAGSYRLSRLAAKLHEERAKLRVAVCNDRSSRSIEITDQTRERVVRELLSGSLTVLPREERPQMATEDRPSPAPAMAGQADRANSGDWQSLAGTPYAF